MVLSWSDSRPQTQAQRFLAKIACFSLTGLIAGPTVGRWLGLLAAGSDCWQLAEDHWPFGTLCPRRRPETILLILADLFELFFFLKNCVFNTAQYFRNFPNLNLA